MRIKVSISTEIKPLEILFLECSRPVADVPKFLSDWVKLVRMCRNAHVRMFREMTKSLQLDKLGKSEDGKEFLRKLADLPILMVQVHCHELKIAVLDRPHCVYYRVRELESFTIPLTPLESSEALVNFVKHWLQLREYLNGIAQQLRDLRHMKMNMFIRHPDINVGSSSMDIDDIEAPSTPSHSEYYPYYSVKKT
jgi:hypothetical protein